MDTFIAFIKAQFAANPARYISYGSLAAVWVVVRVAGLLGSPITADGDVALAVGTVATFILTELIRHFVYSPATVAGLVSEPVVGQEPI